MQLDKSAAKAKHDVSKDMMLASSEKSRVQIDVPMQQILNDVEAVHGDLVCEVGSRVVS